MIKVEVHLCGRLTYVDDHAGITIRTDTEPLEADQAITALLDGGELYRIYFLGGRPNRYGAATPTVLAKLRTEPGERPLVVRAHGCTAAEAVNAPSRVSQAPAGPRKPSAGHTGTPSPERQTAHSSVPTAEPRRTETGGRYAGTRINSVGEGPVCDGCGLVMTEGEYVSVQLGEVYQWAQHVAGCGEGVNR